MPNPRHVPGLGGKGGGEEVGLELTFTSIDGESLLFSRAGALFITISDRSFDGTDSEVEARERERRTQK